MKLSFRLLLSALGIAIVTALFVERPIPPAAEDQPAETPSPVPPAKWPRLPAPRPAEIASTVDPQPRPPRLLPPADVLWKRSTPEVPFARFQAWTERYLAADPVDRSALEAEGAALAQTRREELKGLIQSDPRRALELAVPVAVRQHLPDSVTAGLEQRIDGRGELAVLAALPFPGREDQVASSWRTATLGDRLFTAHVFGRRLDEPTRPDIPLHGLAVDDHLAVDENPIRLLEAVEAAAALDGDPVCGVAGWPAASWGTAIAVDTGDDSPLALCSPEHAEELNQRLIEFESNSGSTELRADGSVRPASAFTEGIKRLILIRVDFPDKPGDPFAGSRGTNLVRAIDQFFQENSYGRAGFQTLGEGSTLTRTLRLPRSTTEYGALDASRLRQDARTAARNAGFVLSDYDFDVICHRSVPGYNWAGLGYVGSPGAWIQDSFDENAGVFCHELGHNFGLNHANFWDTAGESVIGTKGEDVEYGDSFDTMGNSSGGRRHFNVRNKSLLNWLRGTAEIQNATSSGTYQLFAHDTPNASGLRALRIPQNSRTNYWFEYRARFTDNRWMVNGLGVRRARSDNARQSQLLDTTPGSPDGKSDSALVVGRTFSDLAAGIHVTPIRRIDSDPPSLEVVVNRGRFPDNVPPAVSVRASALTVGLNAPVTFSATAADPNGDALAYGWEFGDGSFGSNTDTVTNRWTSTGEYVVRCVVSDLKGGRASDYVVVRVGNPITYRIAGQVLQNGLPLEGTRVFVSNTRVTYTASDGTYVLTGLTPGPYTVKAMAEGVLFTREGFSNPLDLRANRTGVDFIGSLPGDLEFATLVPAGAEWRYQDGGQNLGSAWRASLYEDGTWKRGPAPLGYGDDNITTVLGFGPNASSKYITSYFRHAFVVSEPARILSATLGVIRDDGAVVYLNGREIFRSNMPSGTIGYRTLASSAMSGGDESTYFETELSGADFREGANVLAVEVHQAAADSSDLRFDLRLDALLAPAAGLGLYPVLEVALLPEGVRVSWPSAFSGYSLQTRASLEADFDWEPVDVPVVSLGETSSALLPADESSRFLRLHR